MSEKSKVKGYSRLFKSKSGFKVIRVKDFLRKKDEKDNTGRNILLGVGAVIGAGGVALLLRKNINSKALLKKASNTPLKYSKEATVRVKDVVEDIKHSINNTPSSNNVFSKTALEKYKKPEPRPLADYQPKKTTTKTDIITPDTPLSPKSNFPQEVDPWTLPTPSKYADRGSKLLVKKPVNQNRVRAKDAVTNDPWNTPIKSSLKKESSELLIKKEGVKLLSPAKFKPEAIPDFWDKTIANKVGNSIDTVVKPNSKTTLLLTGKKIPASRGNLLGFDNRTARRVSKKAASDATRIATMEKTYKSISPDNLAMKATAKINHYLIRPRKTSNLGAPPKPTSLEKVVNNPNIKQAQKKIEDRLSRAEKYQLQKKARQEAKSASNAKKN